MSQSRIDELAHRRAQERTTCTLAIFLRSRPRCFALFTSRIPRKPGRTGVSDEKYRAMILDDDRREKRRKGGHARRARMQSFYLSQRKPYEFL